MQAGEVSLPGAEQGGGEGRGVDLGQGTASGPAPARSPPTTGRVPSDHCGHVDLCRFLWIAHLAGGRSVCAWHMLVDMTA